MADELMTADMVEMMKMATLNISSLGEQVGVIKTSVTKLRGDVDCLKEDLQGVKDDMRITRSQSKQIRRAVIGRVNNVLGIEFEGGKVKDGDIPCDVKYRQGFIARCYTDAKRAGVLAECYSDTPRRDYDKALEYIEAWVPEVDGGTSEYKRYLDLRAEAKRKEKREA